MNSNLKLSTMGQTPSPLGMPTGGFTYGVAWGTTVCATGVSISSDRHMAALVTDAFPGTSAWSPPIC
ncbi:MAG: hypothetical protein ACRDOM_07800 [Nocardioides sp.]